MATACLYGNDAERKQHSKAIQMLAEEFGIPEDEIRSVYEDIYSGIREGAKIRDYLVILVSRNVRDSIRKGKYWSR